MTARADRAHAQTRVCLHPRTRTALASRAGLRVTDDLLRRFGKTISPDNPDDMFVLRVEGLKVLAEACGRALAVYEPCDLATEDEVNDIRARVHAAFHTEVKRLCRWTKQR